MFSFLSYPLWGLPEQRYLLSDTFSFLSLRLPHQDWGIGLKLKLPESFLFSFTFTLTFTRTDVSPLWHVLIRLLTATTTRLGNRFEAQILGESLCVLFFLFHIHFEANRNSDIPCLIRFLSFAYGYHIKIWGVSLKLKHPENFMCCCFLSHSLWCLPELSRLWHVLILLLMATNRLSFFSFGKKHILHINHWYVCSKFSWICHLLWFHFLTRSCLLLSCFCANLLLFCDCAFQFFIFISKV